MHTDLTQEDYYISNTYTTVTTVCQVSLFFGNLRNELCVTP